MSNLPGLVVDIEARIDKLEKGLKRANVVQKQASTNMERRAERSANRMSASYGRAGNAAAAVFKRLVPLAAAIGSAGTVRAIGQTVKAVADLGNEAQRAGVPLEAFQEWKFVAEQNRIGVDQMTDGLKELNLRADEFVITGKGPAAEAFARLGFGADELRAKLKDPSALMLEIIDRLGRLDTAGRIRVADEIFGGSAGERFVELIDQGASGLRETIDRAHELGFVLGDDVVRRADELDRKFAELTTRVSSFGKKVAVEIAEGIASVAGLRESLDSLFENEAQGRAILGNNVFDTLDKNASALEKNKREVIDLRDTYLELFRDVNALIGPGGIRVFEIDNEDAKFALADILTGIDDVTRRFNAGQITAEEFTEEMTTLAGEADAVRAELENVDSVGFANVITVIGNLTTAIRTALGETVKLKNELPSGFVSSGRGDGLAEVDARRTQDNGKATPRAVTTSLRPRTAPPLIGERADDPKTKGGGSGKSQSDFEREVTSIAEETAALRLEAQALAELTEAQTKQGDAVELARTKAELLAAAMRSGMTDTPELRAQIDSLADQYVKAATAADLAADKILDVQEASRAGAQSITDVFTGMATGALTAKEAVGQLIVQILKMSLQKRILEASSNAGGTFGKILGVIGGGFAEGGFTGSGGKNEPAGIVHRGEFVMSAAATKAIGVGNLQALHQSARKGYSGGGLVGGAANGNGAPMAGSGAGAVPGAVTINAPVTVNGSSGSPEQNADLASKIAKEMEGTMRGVVVDEIRRQQRPGNSLNNRRR